MTKEREVAGHKVTTPRAASIFHGRAVIGAGLLAAALLLQACGHSPTDTAAAAPPPAAAAPSQSVTLDAQQVKQVHVDAVSERAFAPQVEAVGYVDFDQDHLTQVASPWAGRVREVFAKAGDTVHRGQPLFSVDSPDLAQAEGTLIATLASWTQTQAALQRAQNMAQVKANSQRDLEQAMADEQTAAGNYQAARQALRIFGKSDAAIDRITAARQVDGQLRIDSPIDGQITARAIAPGSLVQPGASPAPFTLAAAADRWLVANVAEADAAQVHVGQQLTATLPALPGRVIASRVDYVGASSDPATHRVMVRAVLQPAPADLWPHMLADLTICTAEPTRQAAVPMDAVVREGDGTMVIFTTRDGLTFTRHPVQLGEPRDGYYPVISGLPANERIAGEGALFLSNALALQAQP